MIIWLKMKKNVLYFEKLREEKGDYSKEADRARNLRETMEWAVNREYGRLPSLYAEEIPKTEEILKSIEKRRKSSYEKYAKGTQERKAAYKKAKREGKEEYSKWLVNEYKRILRSKKSAEWWINNRRGI